MLSTVSISARFISHNKCVRFNFETRLDYRQNMIKLFVVFDLTHELVFFFLFWHEVRLQWNHRKIASIIYRFLIMHLGLFDWKRLNSTKKIYLNSTWIKRVKMKYWQVNIYFSVVNIAIVWARIMTSAANYDFIRKSCCKSSLNAKCTTFFEIRN